MKARYWKLAPVLGAFVFALLSIPGALAQCGMPTKAVKPANWNPQMGTAHLMRAAMAQSNDDDRDNPSIVGMWHVVFTAKTSNGTAIPATVIDNALAVWHADRTEIMNSVRPPQDGNFCLGVWEQTGRCSYKLNHFAWFANQYPNDTNNGIGDPVGPTHFVESVTVSPDGNHFTGTFTIVAYDTSGNKGQSFTGSLSGTRVTTQTTVGDLL
jgi:hypothetical protein